MLTGSCLLPLSSRSSHWSYNGSRIFARPSVCPSEDVSSMSARLTVRLSVHPSEDGSSMFIRPTIRPSAHLKMSRGCQPVLPCVCLSIRRRLEYVRPSYCLSVCPSEDGSEMSVYLMSRRPSSVLPSARLSICLPFFLCLLVYVSVSMYVCPKLILLFILVSLFSYFSFSHCLCPSLFLSCSLFSVFFIFIP